MNIKNLEKANSILAKLKELDARIITLDRLAMRCANGPKSIKLSLNIEDHKEEPAVKVGFDADGSLTYDNDLSESIRRLHESMFTFSFGVGGRGSVKDTKTESTDFNLRDTDALQVLAVLLGSANDERSVLMGKLREMGFNI